MPHDYHFAFTPNSPYGRCLTNFLRSAFEKSQSRETLTSYTRITGEFFSSSVDGIPKMPDYYTREDVLEFIHRHCHGHRSQGEPGPATINQRLATIASFYKYAALYSVAGPDGRPVPLFGYLSPCAGLQYAATSKAYRALSQSELERLFRAMPIDNVLGLRDRAIFLTYLYTSRRRSELLALNYGDIEARQLIEADGSRRVGYTYLFYGKGRKMQRDVAELPHVAHSAIMRYLEASGRLSTIEASDPLFVAIGTKGPGSPGVNRLAPGTIDHALKKYCRLAGLGKAVSIHALRHSSARLRYEAGSDIREIQKILRHSNLATTDTYLRALTSTVDPGARLLEMCLVGL